MDRSVAQRLVQAALVLARDIEVADRTNFDLEKAYKKWNRELFDNDLPRVKLRWNKSKRMAGVAKAKRAADGSWQPVEIAISDFHESTAEEIHAILVHEMIHVKMYSIGVTEAHGKAFMAERRRINQLVGFEVPLTEDAAKKSISRSVAVKPVGVIYIPKHKGIAVFNLNALPKAMSDLDGFSDVWKRQIGPLEFYIVSDRDLARYPIKRKVSRRFAYYTIDDEDLLKKILAGDKQGELLPPGHEAAAMTREKALLLTKAALNWMEAADDFTVGEEITIVVPGSTSAVLSVIKTSPKAVQLKNDNPHGSPTARGKSLWLPRKALKPNPTYSYKDSKAYSLAPWMAKKLDSYQRVALEMSTY